MANCQPGGWLSSAGAYVNGIFLSFQNSRLVPLRMGAEPDHRESPEAAAPGSTARRWCAGRGGPEGSRVLADPAVYRSLACPCGSAETKRKRQVGGTWTLPRRTNGLGWGEPVKTPIGYCAIVYHICSERQLFPRGRGCGKRAFHMGGET